MKPPWICFKYLGRRIEQTHSLLILTFRDDEIGVQHPLQEMLGVFPTGQTIRLPLEPLSENGVAILARKADRPAKGIYQATKGNPFFVTEVLRSHDEQIPEDGARRGPYPRRASFCARKGSA